MDNTTNISNPLNKLIQNSVVEQKFWRERSLYWNVY